MLLTQRPSQTSLPSTTNLMHCNIVRASYSNEDALREPIGPGRVTEK